MKKLLITILLLICAYDVQAQTNNLTQEQIESFKEVMGALQKANYNLSAAGEMMHVHKNTLSYRLDKLRELLHLDPLGNSKDREFCNYFYYYLSIKK